MGLASPTTGPAQQPAPALHAVGAPHGLTAGSAAPNTAEGRGCPAGTQRVGPVLAGRDFCSPRQAAHAGATRTAALETTSLQDPVLSP